MVANAQTDREFLEERARWLEDADPRLVEALPKLYHALRHPAAGYLRREGKDHTLQPTAQVHEAFLQLREQRSVNDAVDVFDAEAVSALDVNRALHNVEAMDPRQTHIAELRFFGALTLAETAEVLEIASATVKRECNIARLWLEREIGSVH